MIGRTGAFLVTLALLLAFEAYTLFVRQTGAPSNLPPASEIFLAPEAAGPMTVVQTFTVHADGLFAIDLHPRPSERPVVGPVVVTMEASNPVFGQVPLFVPVAELSVPAERIAVGGVWHLGVPGQDLKAGRTVRLTIALPQARRGEGLRFEAAPPAWYPEGHAWWLNREAWGDLTFRTYVRRTTIASSIAGRQPSLPPALQGPLPWIAALLLFNLALATLLYYFVFVPDAGAGQTSSANRR